MCSGSLKFPGNELNMTHRSLENLDRIQVLLETLFCKKANTLIYLIVET